MNHKTELGFEGLNLHLWSGLEIFHNYFVHYLNRENWFLTLWLSYWWPCDCHTWNSVVVWITSLLESCLKIDCFSYFMDCSERCGFMKYPGLAQIKLLELLMFSKGRKGVMFKLVLTFGSGSHNFLGLEAYVTIQTIRSKFKSSVLFVAPTHFLLN